MARKPGGKINWNRRMRGKARRERPFAESTAASGEKSVFFRSLNPKPDARSAFQMRAAEAIFALSMSGKNNGNRRLIEICRNCRRNGACDLRRLVSEARESDASAIKAWYSKNALPLLVKSASALFLNNAIKALGSTERGLETFETEAGRQIARRLAGDFARGFELPESFVLAVEEAIEASTGNRELQVEKVLRKTNSLLLRKRKALVEFLARG